MNIPIRHKITDEILFEHDCKDNTQKITLELAIKKDVLLYNADLHDADLDSADLYGADLRKADLCDANLKVKIPPLLDHTFISEILWKKAETENQKDFAARIKIQQDRCWKYFYELAQKKQVVDWAERILGQWQEYKNKIQELKK